MAEFRLITYGNEIFCWGSVTKNYIIVMLTKENIFRKIAKASVRIGNLGLFVGSGFSKAVFDDETPELIHSNISSNPLSWVDLLEKLCQIVEIPWESITVDYKSCPEIASEICKEAARKHEANYENVVAAVKGSVCDIVSWYPNEDQRNVFGKELKLLNPNWIITTNYDLVIEGLLPDITKSIRPNELFIHPKDQIPVYHMHGIKTDPESIIITNEDYIKMFRPDEYRQQRLPFLFMESTTLAIGYGVGDANVLTALDWTQNVYKKGNKSKHGKFIQLVLSPKPKDPYEANGIIVVETNSVLNSLREINQYVQKEVDDKDQYNKSIEAFKKYYEELDEKGVDQFIDDDSSKAPFVQSINNAFDKVSSLGCSFLSRVINRCWQRCAPDGVFQEYAKMLNVLLYCMKNIDFSSMSPALFELIASTLNNLSYYINIRNLNDYGCYKGKSKLAKKIWDKENLPPKYIEELRNYANQRPYSANDLIAILNF